MTKFHFLAETHTLNVLFCKFMKLIVKFIFKVSKLIELGANIDQKPKMESLVYN